MAFDLSNIQKTGENPKPPIITLHGPNKIGKTTIGANAPKPIFLRTEDGTDNVKVDAFDVVETFEQVGEALNTILTQDHDYKTLVVDTIDWMEPLIWDYVCRMPAHNWASIEAPGYGKGYVEAANVWRKYIGMINKIRDTREMTIIQLCHNQIKRFDDPNLESYDRYIIKLHDRASALIREDSDVILFANYKTFTKEQDVGFGNKKTRAVGTGQRVVHTEEAPAYIAGNRYGMPKELPMEWEAIAATIPYFNKPQPSAKTKSKKA